MISVLLLSAILVFHDLPSVLSLAEGDSCITPNNERAVCTRVRACRVIATALVAPTPEQISFAQKSFCGRSTEVLVCCGSSAVLQNPNSGLVYQHRLLPKPDECGQQSTGDKISNGEETDIKEFPWMALLFYTEPDNPVPMYLCGGSLINKRYVLTAAHCVRSSYGRELVSVRLGEHNTETSTDCNNAIEGYKLCNAPAIDYGVQSTVIHSDYRIKHKANDIALIRLNRNVVFADHIQPICLPVQSTPHPANTNVTVAGWGETEKGTNSQVKLKAKLSATTQSECINLFGQRAVITDKQYCAKGICQNGLKCTDTCRGDSGGPSVRTIAGSTKWVQEGITSYGVNICGEKFPAVYTRVSQYVDWIVNNMQD